MGKTGRWKERTTVRWWTLQVGLAERNCCEAANHTAQWGEGWLRQPKTRWWTVGAGLVEQETETQSWLWTTVEVATVGDTPSLTWEFVGKWGYSRAGELHCSLSGPFPTGSAAAAQHRVLPCQGEYLRPCPLRTYQTQRGKEIGPKWKNREKLQKES